jgi:hypothetical protein
MSRLKLICGGGAAWWARADKAVAPPTARANPAAPTMSIHVRGTLRIGAF